MQRLNIKGVNCTAPTINSFSNSANGVQDEFTVVLNFFEPEANNLCYHKLKPVVSGDELDRQHLLVTSQQMQIPY
jgi:hypothetical protein